MKKDIEFPEVKDIHIVAVQELKTKTWYAYLLNKSQKTLESILIVSQAEGEINGELRKSNVFRHAFKKLEPNDSIRIELLDENIFQLENRFMLTFFADGKLHDKNYVFHANSIQEENKVDLESNLGKGILAL